MDDDLLKTGGGLDALSDLNHLNDPLKERVLGDYRIVRLIAEGGMGRVYLAERTGGGFEREVAIKISPNSGVNEQIRQRFINEQGMLASLNHPSIAQLYDAQISEEGWPYFVMEYVDGGSVIAYCDEQRLTLRQRLSLLIKIVDAVAFAHARLIVHRDIKPSNVLVNASGEPKLLDFGIAKLLESDGPALTEAVPMTPGYASPEQLLNQPITTGVDIYQLGLLTYELIVGKPLSEKVTLSDAIERATNDRALEIDPKVKRDLPSDLVHIIEQCLRVAADERYRDAGALRNDLQAFLDGYPVKAVGMSPTYRFGKFAKRNWLSLSAAVIIAVGTVGALIQSNIQRNRIEQARTNLESVTEFQQNMLTGIDPARMGERLFKDLRSRIPTDQINNGVANPTIDEFDRATASINFTDVSRKAIDENILAQAVDAIDTSFVNQPVIASDLRFVVSEIYVGLGILDKAESIRKRALAENMRVFGPEHPDTLSAINAMGAVYFEMGRYEESEKELRKAYIGRVKVLGKEHPHTVGSLSDLGNTLIDLNRNDEARELLQEAYDLGVKIRGPEHEKTLSTATNLGYLYYVQGQYAKTAPLFEAALEGEKKSLGEEHPRTLTSRSNLAVVYKYMGDLDKAIALFTEALEIQKRVQGENHISTIRTINNLGNAYEEQRRFEDAGRYLKQAADAHALHVGPDHPDTYKMQGNYAGILLDLGESEEAEIMISELIAKSKKIMPADHEIIGILLARHGRALRLQNRFDESEAALLEAHEIIITKVGATGSRKNNLLQRLLDLYEDWDKPTQAAAIKAQMDEVD